MLTVTCGYQGSADAGIETNLDCFGGGLSSAANDTILPAASCPASVRMNISVTPR
jgi:hypothetical protein